jgi:dTDP-4-dehydrorhamnose reductase
MKVLLIGANGQLGSELQHAFPGRGIAFVPLVHENFEVRNPEQVASVIGAQKPDVVINTAAFHKVEECERNPAVALETNAIAVWNLARICNDAGAALVHFSTDYVFDGRKRQPYTEEDRPQPVNVYGVSKLGGELLIPIATSRYFLIRTCGLYGGSGSASKGGNFVETMLRKAQAGDPVRVVNDQILTPTSTADLAKAVVQLIETNSYGLYHITNEGECSWFEFARAIFEISRLQVPLTPVATAEFDSSVMRPAYSVLSKEKLGRIGIVMPDWKTGLVRYLRARARDQRNLEVEPDVRAVHSI